MGSLPVLACPRSSFLVAKPERTMKSSSVTAISIDNLTLSEEPVDPLAGSKRRPPVDCWTETILSANTTSSSVWHSSCNQSTSADASAIGAFSKLDINKGKDAAMSLRSFSSALSAKQRIHVLWTRAAETFTCQEFSKLLAITSLPILLVFLLCVQSLIRVCGQITVIRKVQSSVNRSHVLAKLGDALRKESESLKDETNFVETELITDRVLADVMAEGFPTFLGNFSEELALTRSLIHANSSDFESERKWYINRAAETSAEACVPFVASGHQGQFWATLYSYHTLLKAKDLIGLERAIGSHAFVQGGLQLESYKNFSMYNGTADALLLKASMVLSPPARSQFMNIASSEPDLMTSMYEYMDLIFANETASDRSGRQELFFSYFSSLTDYIGLITNIEDVLTHNMLSVASQESRIRKLEFILTLSIVAASLLVCPALSLWYICNSRRLIGRIQAYAEQLNEKKRSIISERKKADQLLRQILPREIVLDIKNSRPIAPEAYEEATVCFSVVEDFAEIVGRCLPCQIVNLLNQLYSKMDATLDRYDAYKVETTGGLYMIASGLPARNGHDHSAIVCTLALHVQTVIENEFAPPHNICDRLRLRIGIHTGYVVAGVVGLKNKRYCLFGDTVNVASRMMSSGMAQRIQISAVTKDHLERHHKDRFVTQLRGVVTIKGRGPLTSYWLIGKKDFPFEIDEGSQSEVASSTGELS